MTFRSMPSSTFRVISGQGFGVMTSGQLGSSVRTVRPEVAYIRNLLSPNSAMLKIMITTMPNFLDLLR
jgi:hypothetical protein